MLPDDRMVLLLLRQNLDDIGPQRLGHLLKAFHRGTVFPVSRLLKKPTE